MGVDAHQLQTGGSGGKLGVVKNAKWRMQIAKW